METQELSMFYQTVKQENEFIYIKPVCDFFQINYENQTRKIKNDVILINQSTKKSNSLMFGDNYPRILLSKKGFIRWIQLINPNTIIESLRQKFVKFQELVFDFLYGSAEDNKKLVFNHKRLTKLNEVKKRINSEITRVKSEIDKYMNNRSIQYEINFAPSKAIN